MAFHGVEVRFETISPPSVRTVDASTIFVLGTAPAADTGEKFGDGATTPAIDFNHPFLLTKRSDAPSAALGTTGTLPAALDSIFAQGNFKVAMVIIDVGSDAAETLTNAIGVSADLTGIYAANAVESVVGVVPRLICAPGMDTGSRAGAAANTLAAAMVIVAGQLRAMAIIDGPNSSHADVITYIGDFDSDRAIVVDPAVLVADGSGGVTQQAASGFATGVIARTDYDIGWWASPSNKTIRGIVGLARPIDAGHANSRAQLMLDNGIWTIVNDVSGYQFWGTDTPAATDPEYSFPNVRRTADIMADSIRKSHRWAVAKGITKNYLSQVSAAVNDFIRGLVAQGALIGGECYPDDELNTAANIALGQAYFNVLFNPVYPANNLVFKMQLTTKYLEDLAA